MQLKVVPVFLYIAESAYGGTPVVSVKADDADIGVNKQFTYAIQNTNTSNAGTTYFQVSLYIVQSLVGFLIETRIGTGIKQYEVKPPSDERSLCQCTSLDYTLWQFT